MTFTFLALTALISMIGSTITSCFQKLPNTLYSQNLTRRCEISSTICMRKNKEVLRKGHDNLSNFDLN